MLMVDILDNHFGNHSGVPGRSQLILNLVSRGESGEVEGFEAKENEWGRNSIHSLGRLSFYKTIYNIVFSYA